MDAVEYLRERARMCENITCSSCYFFDGAPDGNCMSREAADPELAVEMVRRWAAAHPDTPGIALTAMERRFIGIYVEKGYLWAARDKNGELNLYKREPARGGDVFRNTSATVNGCRSAMEHMLPGVTWGNSPVCLPRLVEK